MKGFLSSTMESFLRIFSISLVNFVRNSVVNVTAVSIMLLVSLVISFFLIVALNINKAIEIVENKADVSIFLKDTASPSEVHALQEQLKTHPDVDQEQLRYVTKEEALEIFRGRKTGIDIAPEDNPLPASFEIKAHDAKKLSGIVEAIEQSPAIESNGIRFNKDAVEKILYWAAVLRNLGLGMILFLVLISFMVIINTIRLAIYTRKEEIEIMKLVGATDWFIRWPFIVELSYAGIIASVISLVIFFILFPTVTAQLATILKVPPVDVTPRFLLLFSLMQLTWGACLGAFSSYFATRTHLKI